MDSFSQKGRPWISHEAIQDRNADAIMSTTSKLPLLSEPICQVKSSQVTQTGFVYPFPVIPSFTSQIITPALLESQSSATINIASRGYNIRSRQWAFGSCCTPRV